MPSDIPLIGNYMKKAGYVTAAVGKWHVGNTDASLAINRGFDWVWSMKWFSFFGALASISASEWWRGLQWKNARLRMKSLIFMPSTSR